ncbi:spexin prohormone 2-like [Ambystoma mexicanum]|uniref:spexin prohormone 2-like n=1 Tax=Ambystoma mexicanum TaxID=8296 RepID=UPI0037E7956E
MKSLAGVVCTCAIFMVVLLSAARCAPKNKLVTGNWGPQSMLYLKGRYGRRYVSDEEEDYYKFGLEEWNSSPGHYHSSAPAQFKNFRRRIRAQKVDIEY